MGCCRLASAALFDLGVYFTVVGATLLTISVLGTASREGIPSRDAGPAHDSGTDAAVEGAHQ